jgi:hypothetical protein
MVSYGGRKGEESQETSKPKDPEGPGDEKVVPLFGKRPREGLVPIQAPDERAKSEVSGTGWDERRASDLIDPSAVSSIRPARRALRIALSGATGAVIAATAVVLASGDLSSRSAPALRAAAGEPRSSASLWTHPRTNIFPQLHRSISQTRDAYPRQQARRRVVARRHHVVTKAPTELVSYQHSPASSSGSTSAAESSSYQAPPPPVRTSSQQSTPATTPSASSASESSSASQPTQPGPNGVLICISNCG